MTLQNAKRRFESAGYEVARDVAPYRYKARKVGTLAWVRHHCLYTLLTVTGVES
jgi:hypothetical protein